MAERSESTPKIYDDISENYAEKFSEPSDNIDDFLKIIPERGLILDAGCGPGVDSAYMSAQGFEVIGVDLSVKMLELAKARSPDVRFHQKDIRNMNFDQGSFDGILASYSLIHISKKDVPNVVRDFRKMLKPAGVVCIGIQEGESKELFINEPFKPSEKIFVNVMSAQELRELLSKNGFEILNEFNRAPENAEELRFNKFVVVARKTR